MNDKVQMHANICSKLTQMYWAKNNDYGDSFGKLRSEYKNAILVRVFDKYSRLKTLKEGGNQMVDESIKDTLLDLANYCIMEAVEMEVEDEEISE